MPTVLAWPLRRFVVSRLQAYADGINPPPAGAEPLVSSPTRPVQILLAAPPEPERRCIVAGPVRAAFREVTAEYADSVTETVTLEFRVTVEEPGDDALAVDQELSALCAALAVGVMVPTPIPSGRIWLSGTSGQAPAFTPGPEPTVIAGAVVTFTAEVVGNA